MHTKLWSQNIFLFVFLVSSQRAESSGPPYFRKNLCGNDRTKSVNITATFLAPESNIREEAQRE